MSSPSGQLSSPRCVGCDRKEGNNIDKALQALDGKDVKDLLLNVGSGGGAAAAPAAGGAAPAAAAGGDAPAAEEKKEEGAFFPSFEADRGTMANT